MDLANIFYIVGIVASIIVIIVTIGILVLVFMIYKKIQDAKKAAQNKVNSVIDAMSGKMDFVPFGATIMSLVLPFLKKKMKK